MAMLPQSIEDYIAEDDPVRAYDAFVEALNLKDLGIDINPNKVGNSQYDPRAMLKLLVYGYSYGTKSSRKLERTTYHNMSFIWLMGGLKPDHKTTAEFRRKNKKEIKKVLKKCTRICIKLGLIAGNILNEETKEKLEAQFEQSASQEIYSRRKARVELPFGHIKRNLKTDGFLLRGSDGVQAETSLLATCFNMARMITIIGVPGLIKKLPAWIQAEAAG
jgi:transposase